MNCVRKWEKKKKKKVSTKNLTLYFYLFSKLDLKSYLITEIGIAKKRQAEQEVSDYSKKLQEELQNAVNLFLSSRELTQSLSDNQDTPITDLLTEEVETFKEQLQLENLEKIKILQLELEKRWKRELGVLKGKSIKEILSSYNINLSNISFSLTKSEIFNTQPHLVSVSKNLIKLTTTYWSLLEIFLNNVFLNPFNSTDIVVFLNRIGQKALMTLKKRKSYTIRKFKMKRRKARRIYLFRKLRKIIFFKKNKKKFFLLKSKNVIHHLLQSTTTGKTLIKRIPVSNRVIEATSVEFFYKINKKKNRYLLEDFNLDDSECILYLRNYHQKPYHKLRKARIAHWSLFFKKTLRKQRYSNFLNKLVKKPRNTSYTLNFLVYIFTQLKLSWTRVANLESFLKLYTVEYTKNIVRIPMIYSRFFNWKILKQRSFFLRKKMGRWSYLNFRRATCPWLQRKKNTPKISYHIQPNFRYFNAISYWDSMTNFLFLEKKALIDFIPPVDQFKTNFLVRLHVYRYKANKKCMLL